MHTTAEGLVIVGSQESDKCLLLRTRFKIAVTETTIYGVNHIFHYHAEFSQFLPADISLFSLLTIIFGLIVAWIIVSIPVYVAAKLVTKGKASLWNAMAATLLGPIVYAIVLVIVDLFLGEIVGGGYLWGYILALLAWIWGYKSIFKTGWLGAIAIAILAVLVFIILGIMLGSLFGLVIPGQFFPGL